MKTMTVEELIKRLDASVINMPKGYSNSMVIGGYCGDLLSLVMGRAPAGTAWFTIMTNVNVAAVAALSDVAVVVICEDSVPDDALKERAEEQNICIIKTAYDVFNSVCKFTE